MSDTKPDEQRPDAYAAERRLRDGVRDAVLRVMNETPQEQAYWSRGLELMWEYDGRHPIEAAARVWREGDTEFLVIALTDAIELQRLARASDASRGAKIDKHDTAGLSATDETEAALDRAVRTYVRMQDKLEAEHLGQWALVQHDALLDIYPSREWAVKDAARRCGGQPYLVYEIGSRRPDAQQGGERAADGVGVRAMDPCTC